MMAILRFALLFVILTCLCVPSSSDPVQTYVHNNDGVYHNGDVHGFTYESLVQSPGESDGIVYTDWWYDYYLENNSYVHTIQSWTWQYGPFSGVVMNNPAANQYGETWPLRSSWGSSQAQTSWREEEFDHPLPLLEVTSTVTFEDQFSAQVPVYVPFSLVPEPGSLLALLAGTAGLLGSFLRRKS